MSVTTVSFQHTTLPSQIYLTQLGSDGPPYQVHGVALGAGDVTQGASGLKKKWPSQELQEAATTLEETNLVVDHNNSADGVVGTVTKAGYKEHVGVIYEAELYDEELAEKIQNGLLEVSIRGYHADVDELDEDDETGALVVEDITFDNLSIVPQGASPSNTLEMGEHDELSAEELAAAVAGTTAELLDEVEAGMWVRTDDMHGITVGTPDDGEVEVDVYEEQDGQWRSTGETQMIDTDDLREWDVEESDIGPVQDDSDESEDSDAETEENAYGESDESEDSDESDDRDDSEMIETPDWEEGDLVEWQVNPDMKGRIVHNPDDQHIIMVEVMENGEPSGYTLTAGYTDVRPVSEDTESLADPRYSQGDWVEWDTRNSTEKGTVLAVYHKGDDLPDFRGDRNFDPEEGEHLYALRMYKQRDGTWHPIKGKPIAHYGDSLRATDEPASVSESAVELGRSNIDEYTVEKHDWVQWYPSDTTEAHGFVLEVDESAGDDDETSVTIEVWTQNSDGEWVTDGEEITKSMENVGPWGNFPRGQEEFADEIEPSDPRRAVQPGKEENSSEQLVSQQVEQALKDKVEEHNEEYGDEDGKRVTYRMLKNVFERGMGAYQDSHREGMTPQQWSYARVNAFLYLVRNGQPENDQYVQDNDLLPEDHPKYDEDAPDDADTEENALTTADVIVQDVFGRHDPMGLDDEQTLTEIFEHVETAELKADEDELDNVWDTWNDHVNMTASELRRWSKNPCSREASQEPVRVINRNLRLLERNKDEWTETDIADAKRTISFISRMRGTDTADKDGGAHGCPSKRDISLLNWAYNPFDSLPEHPDDDALDSVEEVTLAADEGETLAGEASDVASLVEYEMHEVEYDGTHEREWDRPNMEDFVAEMDISEDINEYDDLTRDAQEEIASAFIISSSGFPADDYGDLKLPVVEPSGELSVNALAAVKGGRGVSAVDGLADEMETDIVSYVNELANEEFDRNWGDEEEMAYHNKEDDSEMADSVPAAHMFESKEDAEAKAEEMGIAGAHKMGDMWVPGNSHEEYAQAIEEMASTATDKSVEQELLTIRSADTTIQVTTMNDELEAELSDLDNPVAVEAEELERLENKADRLDELSENLEALRERTEVLDEVDQDALDELQATDDPVVVESESYEQLETEAEQVKNVYAASLSEEMPAFEADELADRFSIEELREKFEAEVGSVEEELAASSENAEPRGQDPSEEKLSETDESDSEELHDAVAEKQEELRQKILST